MMMDKYDYYTFNMCGLKTESSPIPTFSIEVERVIELFEYFILKSPL